MSFTNKIHLTSVVVLAVMAMASLALAQDSGAGYVAVLDVAKVFENNLDFDTKMKSIQGKADQLRKQIQQKQEQIRLDAQALQAVTAGSPEAKQLEAELEQRNTALRTEARQSENDLLMEEAKVYYDTYQRMLQQVAALAQQNNVSIVLRFDGSPIDPKNRADVIKGVNRNIVYQYRSDFTTMVIEAMGPTVASAQNMADPTSKNR